MRPQPPESRPGLLVAAAFIAFLVLQTWSTWAQVTAAELSGEPPPGPFAAQLFGR